MNDKKLDRKIQHDAGEIKKDLSNLMGDGASKISNEYEKIKSEVTDTLVTTSEAVKKDIRHGLNQYNARVQKFADKAGDLGKKAIEYPWVTISLGLMIGLFLGVLLKPSRQS